MDLIEFFEYPVPKISIDKEKIELVTNVIQTGSIHIKNLGGGILTGQVICTATFIKLNIDEFRQNNLIVNYEASPIAYTDKNVMQSDIKIISNGGQITIPIFIEKVNNNYILCSNKKVYKISEFYQFYKKSYVEAIRVFYSYEFMLWLEKIDFKHTEMVEHLLTDTNKHRAVDSFFIFCNMKEKAYIKIEQNIFRFRYFDEKENIIGEIPLKLIGDGYIEDTITTNNDEIVTLINDKITNKDFDKDNKLLYRFEINVEKIKVNFQKIKILFNNMNKDVIIELNKKKPLEINFDKIYFKNKDNGNISIINNTNKEIQIEVTTNSNIITLHNEYYDIKKFAEIGFKVNLKVLLKAQMEIVKKPYEIAQITIKTRVNDKYIEINQTVYVGSVI